MVAPIPRTDDPSRSRRHRHAHHWVAGTLLRPRAGRAMSGPPVAAWKAWLFAGWVIAATSVYAATMTGLL